MLLITTKVDNDINKLQQLIRLISNLNFYMTYKAYFNGNPKQCNWGFLTSFFPRRKYVTSSNLSEKSPGSILLSDNRGLADRNSIAGQVGRRQNGNMVKVIRPWK